MIDKSIRQHYSTGDEVKKFGYEAGQKLISPLKNKYIAQDTGKIKKTEIAKDIGINLAKKAVARKLGLASLNPILGLLSLFGFKPFKTLTEGGVKQAFTAGMTGTQADYETARELRQLEKRRDYMLHRRDVLGKKISDKNLKEVTDQINTIKKTAPTVKKTSPISYEDDLATTTIKDILDKKYEHEDKKTAPLRTTPIIDYEYEAYNPPTAPIRQDPDTGDASIAERIAAENRAKTQAAAIKAENDRQQREADAAAAAAARAYTPPVHHHTGGNGNVGGHRGGAPSHSTRDLMSKGGRVDKALGGRSRDI